MKSIIVIPARYGATRFPGKSLVPLRGRPMLQWVWEAARRSRRARAVIVATDDRRIARAAEQFGAEVAMTRKSHRSGTDRMAEVARRFPAHLYVNLQGDEPLISPAVIDSLIAAMEKNRRVPIGTLAHRIASEEELIDPNVVKVVRDRSGRALYFSRSPVPFPRELDPRFPPLRHVGIYAFRASALAAFVRLKPGILEKAESLEQLRALENRIAIQVVETKYRCLGVDTPADLERVEALLDSARVKKS